MLEWQASAGVFYSVPKYTQADLATRSSHVYPFMEEVMLNAMMLVLKGAVYLFFCLSKDGTNNTALQNTFQNDIRFS